MNRTYRLLTTIGGLLLASAFVLRGNLGWSTSNSAPVSQVIVDGLPATMELAFAAFAVTIAFGAIAGFVRAQARAPVLRGALAVVQLVCRALPVVVFALFLQLLVMFATPIPIAGFAAGETFDLRDRLVHLILPVFVLAVPFGAWSSLIFYDFFRAPAGGTHTSMRSFVGPVAEAAASIGPALLSASVLVEPIVAWPGLARPFFNAVSLFDTAVIAGILLTYAVGVVLIKLWAELVRGDRDRALPSSTVSPRAFATRTMGFSPLGLCALVVLLCAALGAVAANVIVPIGPYFIDQVHWQGYPLAPGVAGHLLGTDENGRDLLSRLLFALRTSLGIAGFAAVVAAAIGAVVAKVAKAVPWLDDRTSLSVTGIRPFGALPFIFAAITILVGTHRKLDVLNPLAIALIIAAISWPAIVPAFRARRPATLGAVVDVAACALLLEVTLSIHGFGVQPPTSSLGNMLVNAQSNVSAAPWAAFIPSGVIVVMLFALYALGDELRERGRISSAASVQLRSERPA